MIAHDAAPLVFALEYARAGLKVIPVRPRGKTPLTEHGAHDATTDPAKIREWFSAWPDGNIGIALGGLVAVDVDPRNGGDVDMLAGKIPDTCHARTGGNGDHFLMRAVNGSKYPAHPAPGIDVKSGPGAYIVAEPSTHPSGGRYMWMDESEPWNQQPAEAPAWLAESAPAHEREEGHSDAIPEGRRNERLTSMAGAMRHKGMNPEAIIAALLIENRAKCNPPLADAEIRRIAASVARYEPGARPAPDVKSDDWKLADIRQLAERDPEPPDFIMEGLPAKGVTLLAGHGGVGKSIVAFLLAVCVALGIKFCGLATKRRRVLFASCEDDIGVLHWRLRKICDHLRIDMRDLDGALGLLDLTGRDALLYLPPSSQGANIAAAYGRMLNLVETFRPDLLVIDGVAHSFGGDEIRRRDVTGYINALASLAPAALTIGHVDKVSARMAADNAEAYSGSTAWSNAVRSRWSLLPERDADHEGEARSTGRLVLENRKTNHARPGLRIVLEWDAMAHVFVGMLDAPESDGAGGMVGVIEDRQQRAILIGAIRAAYRRRDWIPESTRGEGNCVNAVQRCPGLPDSLKGPRGRNKVKRLIADLRGGGELVAAQFVKPDRKRVTVLAPPDMVDPDTGRVDTGRVCGGSPVTAADCAAPEGALRVNPPQEP